jgi:hypothetical protein
MTVYLLTELYSVYSCRSKKELEFQEKRMTAELNCLSKKIDTVTENHNLNLNEIQTMFLQENEINIKMEQIIQNFKENLNETS